MAQQGRRNQRKDPQQPGRWRYIKQQSTMQELIDEKRIVFNENQESDKDKKNLGELARETVEKKRQLEVILKKLDEEEKKYPSAKMLFSDKGFAPAEINNREVIDDYKTVCNKFSDIVNQCDKVALIHRKGTIANLVTQEEIDFIGENIEESETLNRKRVNREAKLEELLLLQKSIDQLEAVSSSEGNSESSNMRPAAPSAQAAAAPSAQADEPSAQAAATSDTANLLKELKQRKEEKREELARLDEDIEDFKNYAKEAQMLLRLGRKGISDKDKQNIVEFTIEQLVKRGANREELYVEENVHVEDGREKIFGTLNTGKAQRLISNRIAELTMAEDNLTKKENDAREANAQGIKNRNAKEFAKVREHEYETIGEGACRIFVAILGEFIGDDGIFPTQRDVYYTLVGKDLANTLSSLGKIKDAGSTKDMGEILHSLGKSKKKDDKTVEALKEKLLKSQDALERERIRELLSSEYAVKFDAQQKMLDSSESNKLNAEDMDRMRKASCKAVEKVGEALESVSNDSDPFAEKQDVDAEDLAGLNALMVPERGKASMELGENGIPVNVVNLRGGMAKRIRLSKLMGRAALIAKAVASGSTEIRKGLGDTAKYKAGNKPLDFIGNLVQPIPPEPFTESKPVRGDTESQKDFDLRMQTYEKAYADYLKRVENYKKALAEFQKNDEASKKNQGFNQNEEEYKRNYQLYNILNKGEIGADIIHHGAKAIGGFANFVSGASAMSFYNDSKRNLYKQAIGILSRLKNDLQDEAAKGRIEHILNALKGSKLYVDASYATKKRLDLATALDEMTGNPGYKLSPDQIQKIFLAASVCRARSGVQYKKDAAKLNLIGGAMSAVSDTVSAIGNAFTIAGNNPLVSIILQLSGASGNIITDFLDEYAKKIKKRDSEKRNKMLARNITSVMKLAFSLKAPDGELPSLSEFDSSFEERDGGHFYRQDADLDVIKKMGTTVMLMDLMKNSGTDIAGLLAAIHEGYNEKHNPLKGPESVTDDNALLDSLMLTSEKKGVEHHKMVVLSKIANI